MSFKTDQDTLQCIPALVSYAEGPLILPERLKVLGNPVLQWLRGV